jgi:thiamine-phosphate pyrophosphorylase
MRGGVDVVQLRDNELSARGLIERGGEAAAVCADFGVPFILNDRPDLALACGADGVHVGQDDAPPSVAREILGPDAVIGLSTHASEEWTLAAHEPVDYLSAGPVNATPTKPGRAGTGVGYLSYAASTSLGSTTPWFVTGGVTPETIPDMAANGARRFVVVRYLTESDEPESAARRLRVAVDSAAGWG